MAEICSRWLLRNGAWKAVQNGENHSVFVFLSHLKQSPTRDYT
jgi:hypothetical protein